MNKKTLLIAEDDWATSAVLKLSVENICPEKFNILIANTISEAEILIKNTPHVDLFLMDYFMEGGHTCSPLVKATKAGAKIYIITAASIRSDVIIKETGVSGVLRKPFDFTDLQKILDSV